MSILAPGLNRLDHLDRPTTTPIHRMEMSRPGELLHVDINASADPGAGSAPPRSSPPWASPSSGSSLTTAAGIAATQLVNACYRRGVTVPLPDGIVDRPADVWKPLIIIADHADRESSDRVRRAAVVLNQQRRDRDPSLGDRVAR